MVIKLLAGGAACFFIFSFSFSHGKNLSTDPVWLGLLHYKNGKSEIDDPEFFLSENGKTDPEAELQATLEAFKNSTEEGDKHPICRFPARYYFLKKHIKINLKTKPDCRDLNDFLKEINPDSVSIVFSDAYINSPASMYGHTFLRIDPPVKSRLLGYAVNYAANADSSEGFKYYIKGIFGFYKGFFSIFPYYKKIFEYNNLESRDLWEYSLKVPKDRVYLITLHLWELRDRYAYYYFFDKNCSYQILHLIDISRPDLNAVNNFNLWTIPVDTIRFLKSKNLIDAVYYRPSASSRIKALIKSNPDITKEDIKTASQIARFEIKPEEYLKKNVPTEKKAKVLELSKLIFSYYSIKERMPYKEYRKKFLRLLRARSKVHYVVRYKGVKKIPPDMGHKSRMLSIKTGSEDGQKFVSFVFRGAYHGLEDDDKGYIFGSEILFPYFEVRNFPDKSKTVLNELSLIKIKSYSIRDIVFRPVSWQVSAGFKRDWYKEEKNFSFNFSTGFGFTYGEEGNYFYSGIIKTTARVNTRYLDKSDLNSGIEITFLKNINRNKTVISFYPYYSFGINSFAGFSVILIDNFSLNNNTAFQIKTSLNRVYYKNRYQISISLNRFF